MCALSGPTRIWDDRTSAPKWPQSWGRTCSVQFGVQDDREEETRIGGCGAVGVQAQGVNLVSLLGRLDRCRVVVRAICVGLVYATLQLAGAGVSVARDRVVLPFSCSIANGRLRVEPAPEQSYPIVGSHEQQPFTHCPAGGNGSCRTWMLHRFSVQCTGGRAAWPEIVVAATRDGGRVAMEAGQLLLRIGPNRVVARDAACADFERGTNRSLVLWQQCQLSRTAAVRGALRTRMLAMPRGFAPLGLIGARLLIDADPPSAKPPFAAERSPPERIPAERVAPVEASVPASAPVVQSSVVQAPVTQLPAVSPPAALSPAASSEVAGIAPSAKPLVRHAPAPAVVTETLDPAEDAVPIEAVAAVALAAPSAATVKVGWITRVEAASTLKAGREDASAGAAPTGYNMIMLMLVATALLAFGGLAVRRRRPDVMWRPVGTGTTAGDAGDAPRAMVLRSKAEGHIVKIETALSQLTAVPPLRNALARDMQTSQRRLSGVMSTSSLAAAASTDEWSRARRRLERVAQDLDRLQQIADSAVSSLSGLQATRSLPRNRDEAFATLGVTAGVSEAILKKLVEALRISWHPDLAVSEADREARDVRIKEINVAWDLITGKRTSE